MTELDRAIRAFSGPDNIRLRRMIRNSLAGDIDPRTIARHVALTAPGKRKLDLVYEAWQAEKRQEP
jgi:hypothetical protein